MPSSKDRYDTFARLYLTPRTDEFQNIYRSAVGAGFSAKYAKTGEKLLNSKGIQEALERFRKKIHTAARKKGKIASPEEVLISYTNDLRFDPAKLTDKDHNPLPLRRIPKQTRMSLVGITYNRTIQSVKKNKKSGDITTIVLEKAIYKFPNKNAIRDSMAKIYGFMNGDKDAIRELLEPMIKGLNVQVNVGNDAVQIAMRAIFDSVDGMTRGIPALHYLNEPKREIEFDGRASDSNS